MSGPQQKLDYLFSTETNVTLKKGSLYSAIMGLTSSGILLALQSTGFLQSMDVPIVWTLIGGVSSLLIYKMAAASQITGNKVYLVVFIFSSLPSLVYILAFFHLPSGPGTYITGPPSYLYFFMIAVSALTFNKTACIFSGYVAGIEYLIAFLFGQSELNKIQVPDPLMFQDLTSAPIYFFKSMMMVFTGYGTGVAASTARKLMSRILKEEEEKNSISRLFGQYVSPEVKDKILKEKLDRISEIRDVAILFCDIRDYTSFSEQLSPDELVIHLNEYFDKMVSSITEFEGTIDKFIGDAVMAVFGGLLPLANPSENALLAAISMRKALEKLNQDWKKEVGISLNNGIGIHYGKVLQGSIGSSDRKDFTVIGDSVNTASRIESLCKETGNPILYSREVYDLLPPDLREMSVLVKETSVKGRKEKVILYSLTDSETMRNHNLKAEG